jgi:hypothetical protein
MKMKKLLPYLVAIVVFVLLALVYASPIFEGKRLKQNDIKQYEGAAKELVDYHKQTGDYSKWTGSMFSGMPAYQIAGCFTANKTKVFNTYIFGSKLMPYPASVIILYCLGFFVLLLVLRVNPWMSIVGAVAFAFSSYFFIIMEAGHITKSFAIGFMPFIAAGIILLYQKKYLLGLACTTLFITLQINANHPQITYYTMLCMGVFGIVELITTIIRKTWKPFLIATGCLIVAMLISLGVNTNVLLTTYEYSKESIRGKSELTSEQKNRTSGLDLDYATAWSYGKTETFTLMIPDFMGGANQRTPGLNSNVYDVCLQNGVSKQQATQIANSVPMYWGNQPFTSGPIYVGAIICFLFVLGLFVVKGKYKWWLLGATVLSILLAWGKNFMPFTEFFMHYVPGYNKFRAVSMTLVIAEFTMPLLGFLALKELWNKTVPKEKLLKKTYLSLGITGGLCLIFILFKGVFFNFSVPSDSQYGLPQWLITALESDRASMLTKEALRSLIFILLAAVALFLFQKEKINKFILVVSIAALILIDMWTVDKRYVNDDNFVSKKAWQNQFSLTAADKQILEDKDPNYRVYNQMVSSFNDATTSYYHKSIGGYHGAKLRRYQEIIDRHLSKGNMNVYNMLNTKYFVFPDKNNAPLVQKNPNALGNAWFVQKYNIVPNADEEIASLDSINPAQTAIVDQRFSKQLEGFACQNDSTATITFEEYKPDYLRYHSETATPGLAVFSEVYYDKGWNAYLDGQPVPYFRTDYVLRGMIVPVGDHTIEFKFEPATFKIGENISFIFSFVFYGLIVAVIVYEIYRWKKRRNNLENQEV